MGFEMYGIDFYNVVIERAKAVAGKDKLSIELLIGGFTQELKLNLLEFNFAFDYGLLHHIFPEKREIYARNVAQFINRKVIIFQSPLVKKTITLMGKRNTTKHE